MVSSIDQPDKVAGATTFDAVFDWGKRMTESIPPIHPGHMLMVASAPFLLRAYRGYRTPLEAVVQSVLKSQNSRVKIDDLKSAEESVRRAVGSAVAGRALRVANSASVGIFGVSMAFLFYATGCNTVEHAVTSTEKWAHAGRQKLDRMFGVERVDRDHPEYIMMKGMTEEEELEYMVKSYLPDEEWDTGLEKDDDEKID